VEIRSLSDRDREPVAAFLGGHNAAEVARMGELVRAMDQSVLVATEDERVAGVLSFVVTGAECEVLTLHVAESWQGVGSALLAELDRVASERGCSRMWLITTNDNVDALRFYQRRGFHLSEVHPGAIDSARANLKPTIPTQGSYGIPIRDELLLERRL
jgi:ribosomal protein S18 acetylase RimI-like enzyme